MKLIHFVMLSILSCTLLFTNLSFAKTTVVNAPTQVSAKPMQLAYMRCHHTGGFWRNGVWHQGRRVCVEGGRRHRCYWTGGYRRHGVWYRGHKVCY